MVNGRRDGWPRRLAARVATLWPLKMVGTMAWIATFFWLYFWVQRNPAPGTALRRMPVTPMDHWFDVQDWAVLPYASLWVYVSLAPALAKDLTEIRRYVRAAALLCVLGFACFWLFPTAVPDFGVDWSGYPLLGVLKARDQGLNAFPSLHVGFAVLSAAFMHASLRDLGAPAALRWANHAWAVLVVWSVFATRQHVVVDALGGLAVAWLAWRAAGGPAAGPQPVSSR